MLPRSCLPLFDKDLYIQKFYELENKIKNTKTKEIEKKHEENNNINLNKIIKGNPMKIKYTKEDLHDEKQLINKLIM